MKPSTFLLLQRFSPASIFRSGASGLWLEQSDVDAAYQDSAATTAGAVDAPVGKRTDKSGRGLHVSQTVASARPTLKAEGGVYSDLLDGTNDGYVTATFSAGTLTSNMDCFVAIKRAGSGAAIPMHDPNGVSLFFGYHESGAAGTAVRNGGSASSIYVNGVAVPGGATTTAGQLHTAMPAGQWLILEVRNIDLSAWTSFGVSTYGGLYFSGNVAGPILCPAQTDGVRTQIRRYLARKVGASL